MTDQLSFASDIKPLFREKDQREMDFMFDLWDYQDVCDNATDILGELEGGGMPCDGAWPSESIELFRRWMEDGMSE